MSESPTGRPARCPAADGGSSQRAPLVRVIAQLRFLGGPLGRAARLRRSVPRGGPPDISVLARSKLKGIPGRPWRHSASEASDRRGASSRRRRALACVVHAGVLGAGDHAVREPLDFSGRLRVVAEALGEHVEPGQIDRLGVRYIDSASRWQSTIPPAWFGREVRGIAGTLAATHAAHALSEWMFDLGDARVLARWGRLPPGVMVDPAAIEPSEEKSWILDLDMFSAAPMPFVVDRVVAEAERYAGAYTISSGGR